MGERVNREAQKAAMRAVIHLEDDTVDPTLAQRVDAAVAAALPLLTPQDVPHVAAQALRDAAERLRDDMDEPWGMRAANRLDAYAVESAHRSAVDATTPPDTHPSDPRPIRNAQEGEQR